jgi:hypothetical protein
MFLRSEQQAVKGSLLALFALLAALSGVASAQAGPDSSQAVWWASRAAGENWLLERTIVTRVDCGPSCLRHAANAPVSKHRR